MDLFHLPRRAAAGVGGASRKKERDLLRARASGRRSGRWPLLRRRERARRKHRVLPYLARASGVLSRCFFLPSTRGRRLARESTFPFVVPFAFQEPRVVS